MIKSRSVAWQSVGFFSRRKLGFRQTIRLPKIGRYGIMITMIETNEILEKLNEEQIKPVLQTEGAVLVLAGAGSGKTRVLTSRIAYLIEEKGVPAAAILAITFTNKAAKEMQERLSKIVDVSRSWVCTIHSMCVRILRMYATEAGINANFSIYSETERNNIIKKSFQECDFDDEKLLKSVKYTRLTRLSKCIAVIKSICGRITRSISTIC